MDEKSYIQGQRSVYTTLLVIAKENLGYSTEKSIEYYIAEREDTMRVLRALCEEFGDNDWEYDLYLPDIIEKHLENYLYDKKIYGPV